ncbi:excisionase [Stenotrophomonas acidaminiphila]|uniref:excisionase n=1 Tax=Stenotrophomonas acidaminiphila TaxID=128780 RepID=UPI0024AE616A|nr:excisionase [Stenotrophomonas acidaminiphila]WHL17613.1 excisionase [Stenotrophomonas acidaminiphila]
MAEIQDHAAPSIRGLLRPLRFVTIEKFEELTGYTPDATRSKIKRGDWLEGVLHIKAPDGRILMDIEGYEWWVLNGAAGSAQLQKAASR